MTRAEFRARLRRRLKEVPGTDAYLDPITLDELMDEAVGEVASKTDACYGQRTTDTEAGKSKYCLPDLYKVKVVLVKDVPDADYSRLRTFTSGRFADLKIGTRWRNSVAPDRGKPTYAVFEGTNRVHLYPAPAVAVPDGFLMEGFYRPNRTDWSEDDDECPLAMFTGAEDCAIWWAMYLRGGVDYLPEAQRRLDDLEAITALHHRGVN